MLQVGDTMNKQDYDKLAFEHWQKTGKYLYKGVEYTDVPHELEVDLGRGVLYLHNLIAGTTVLRVCRIPRDTITLVTIGTPVIDLINSPSGGRNTAGKVIKRKPAFLEISGSESMMDMRVPPTGSFQINNEAGQSYFDFKNVPGNLLYDLWMGKFVDITMGYTGVNKH